jgi:multidrug efflux system membrane fusion protein
MRSMIPRAIAIINIILFFLTTGCANQSSKPPEHKYPVKVSPILQQNVPYFIETIGNVSSPKVVQIRPQVGGIIIKTFAREGDNVKEGDPLYQIDPRPYKAALEKAKGTLEKDRAALAFTEIRIKRYQDLANKDYLSKLTFEQYQSDLQAAKGQVISDEADVALAELNLEWTTPKAPITGRVSQSFIDPGNLVQANDPNAITDIRQMNPLNIVFSITQKEFAEVQKATQDGQLKLFAFLPKDPENPREAVVYFIDNHLDLSTGTIAIKGRIQNEDETFWPGQFVRVKLQLRIDENALLVPDASIQTGQQGPFVFVYNSENETVEYRPVIKGSRWNGMTVIQQGLEPGEHVVTQGQLNLRPNAKVFIATDKETP